MEISQILIDIANKLKKNPYSSANIEARLLLSHILKINIAELFLRNNCKLTSSQNKKLLNLIERRISGEPMSYILAKREFYGNEFYVNKNVLDPRCDSETMIELIIQEYQNFSSKSLELIELGIGSGCLIISLLNQFKLWIAIAVDISFDAISVAKKNSKKFNLTKRLKIIKSDLFSKIKLTKKFDIIISNPPYIPSLEIHKLQNEVAIFEPKIALDGGEDGLDFYRIIAKKSGIYLKKNGSIYLEIGHDQMNQVIEIFAKEKFYLYSMKKDLANIVRILHFKQC